MDSIVPAALGECLRYWIGLNALYAAIVECIDYGISHQCSEVRLEERLLICVRRSHFGGYSTCSCTIW